jgi:DNA-binding transcriptional MerR regulator
VDAGMTEARHRIGQVADSIGVSTRTLRYYEELGLVQPSGHSAGGSRRYSASDVERVLRVRELQAIVGFNLDEIREILQAEDRLAELRTEYRKGVGTKRAATIITDAARLNARIQEQVLTKIAILEAFQAELEDKADRYRAEAAKQGFSLTTHASP